MSLLTDPTQQILAQALDGLSTRESLIGSNLANIDTPGYQPQSIDFETALKAEIAGQGGGAAGAAVGTGVAGLLPPSSGPSAATALRTTDPRQFLGDAALTGSTAATHAFAGTLRNDGNAVDVESEMTALVNTQIKYSAVARLETGKLGLLIDAIGAH